jgi:hypothetical protein
MLGGAYTSEQIGPNICGKPVKTGYMLAPYRRAKKMPVVSQA